MPRHSQTSEMCMGIDFSFLVSFFFQGKQECQSVPILECNS